MDTVVYVRGIGTDAWGVRMIRGCRRMVASHGSSGILCRSVLMIEGLF